MFVVCKRDEGTYLLFKEQRQKAQVFTVQRTKIKETEMYREIDIWSPQLPKGDIYVLSPKSRICSSAKGMTNGYAEIRMRNQ